MLLELPADEIRRLLMNHSLFLIRTFQARALLEKQKAAAKMTQAISENSEPSQSPKETQEG